MGYTTAFEGSFKVTPPLSQEDAALLRDFSETRHEGADQSGPKPWPGIWCDWVPSKDGSAIKWNDSEKFYSYIEWIEYLIRHFLAPRGYRLNGTVTWQGESVGDVGQIRITENQVRVLKAKFEEEA